MRKPNAFPLPFVAILATLAMVCASLFGFVPATPKGVQCPTAAVQTVTVRTCCGRLVTRAPEPGERAFLQCRCAEKKTAAHDSTVPSKLQLYFVAGEPLQFDAPPRPAPTVPAFAATFRSVGFPPIVRPPTAS